MKNIILRFIILSFQILNFFQRSIQITRVLMIPIPALHHSRAESIAIQTNKKTDFLILQYMYRFFIRKIRYQK
jgi:hypothetical protein